MAAKPNVPNLQPSERVPTNSQPPPVIHDNPPAESLTKALANAEKQYKASDGQ